MKRILILLSLTIVAFIASAKSPQLAVEKLFDGRYNSERSVSTSISKDNGMYFRVLRVADNQQIVQQIYDTLSKDASAATNYFEQTGEGGKSVLIKISRNDGTVDIGFQQDPSGKSASLFIRGPEKAFR